MAVSAFECSVFWPHNLSVRFPGTAPTTLGLIIGGLILFALGAVYEVRTSREALFPPQLFKDISCGAVTSFLSLNLVFTGHGYSCDTHRGVFTQFLFHYWNLLYCYLFPGEVLTDPKP